MTANDLAALAPAASAASVVVGIGAGIVGRRLIAAIDEQRNDRGPKPPARRRPSPAMRTPAGARR